MKKRSLVPIFSVFIYFFSIFFPILLMSKKSNIGGMIYEVAEKMIDSCELPDDGEYLDDSMEIDSDVRDDIEVGSATLMVGKFPAADVVRG